MQVNPFDRRTRGWYTISLDTVRGAVILAIVAAFGFGTAVAKTVGAGLVDPADATELAVVAALLAAITWNLITWYRGIPSSSSHALIGGIMGAAIAHGGVAAPNWLASARSPPSAQLRSGATR